MGWMPSYPTFDRNPLDLADEAAAAGRPVAEHVVEQLKSGDLRFACEDPDAPENFPRILSIWRANLLGSSGKGNEYFLKHLLGTDTSLRATEAAGGQPAAGRRVARRGARGEARPAAHPRLPPDQHDDLLRRRAAGGHLVREARPQHHRHAPVHALVQPGDRAAVADPHRLGRLADASPTKFSELAAGHLGTRKDVVAVPLLHDTPDAMANPHGIVRDWKHGECEPVPGVTMPKLVEVERDYAAVGAKMAALGPLMEKLGTTTKGITYDVTRLGRLPAREERRGPGRGRPTAGPSLERDVHACEAILALSGTTNGHLATQGFKTLEKRTGTLLHDLAAEHEGKQITFADTQAAPMPVITSPEWSGSETGGRRYSPFTINVERLKPWHTLTGRQHFYLDHDWMSRARRGAAGLPATAEHGRAVRRARRSATSASWG